MFVRTTASGRRIAVGSGVPKDWTPEYQPRQVAARNAKSKPKVHRPAPEPTPEPVSVPEPVSAPEPAPVEFMSALDL